MRSYITYFLIGTIFLISGAFIIKTTTPKYIDIPKNWPKPFYDFKNNPSLVKIINERRKKHGLPSIEYEKIWFEERLMKM